MTRRSEAWWLAPEPIARDAASLIRIRSRVLRIRSHEAVQRSRELRVVTQHGLTQARKLLRKSHYLVQSGHPLPRIVQPKK